MKVLYYDLFCGISGDMNLGALVDLGVDIEYLKSELHKLNIDEEFDIVTKTDMKHGISGTKLDVVLHNQEGHEQEHNHHGGHSHGENAHTHEGHSHGDDVHTHEGHTHGEETHTHEGHSHGEETHTHEGHSHGEHTHSHSDHSHEHRTFAMIKQMIQSSDLEQRVKDTSIEIFRLIAVAEGKVHNKPMDEVHFHEVGATDSIVDIVGAAICLHYLNVDKVMASSVQVGGGFVRCAHGRMPVPAPATAEILEDVPLKYNVVPFETTTPTGAAILKATVDEYSDQHELVINRIGYGLGFKDFEIPNILRVYLGEIKENKSDLEVEEQFVMSCNIDDMNSEVYTYVEHELFKQGALDVYKTPIIMKKGRPATKLSVLFKDEDRERLQQILFTETTTAGVRESRVTKYMMKREFVTVTTKYGNVSVKKLFLEGELVKSKAEYEDCLKLAKQHNVGLSVIYKELNLEEI